MDPGIALTVGTVGVPDGGAAPSASGVDDAATHGRPTPDPHGGATGEPDAGPDEPAGGPDAARRPDGDGEPVPGPGEVALVRLTGRLGPGDAHDLAVGLAAVLTEHPRVVADVSGVELAHSAAVHAFTDAQDRAGGWPRARLVLAAPGPLLTSLLASSRVARRVPVHPDVATAVALVDQRPASVRAYWSFGVDPHAPGTARGHLRRVCAAWDVDDEVREAAEIVVTELVTNAVEHASSPTVVAVERLTGSFRLAVRDFDTRSLPDVALPSPTSARGRGLAMVAAVSREWGVHTHADGKTVWSEMGA